MRVISGQARGRKLKMVPGKGTRPVTDRVKEAVFNIVGGGVRDSRWLDLFGGTGAIGVEALSRGAKHVDYCETNRQAVRTIRENLALTGFETQATIHAGDAIAFLRQPARTRYDFIYVAPPQYKEMWLDAVDEVAAQPEWLAPDGWLIVQIHPKEFRIDEARKQWQALVLDDQRKYGTTLVLFYSRAG